MRLCIFFPGQRKKYKKEKKRLLNFHLSFVSMPLKYVISSERNCIVYEHRADAMERFQPSAGLEPGAANQAIV